MKSTATTKFDNKEIAKQLGFDNIFQVPRIDRVVINVGVGSKTEKEQRQKVAEAVSKIIGQKMVPTKAKKSVAAFKIRQGNTVGFKATIRGERMYHFLDKLVHVALPRTRDFQGITQSSVTPSGINIGLRDISIFPEIKADSLPEVIGMQINVITQKQDKATNDKYFKLIGFPLAK